MSRSFSGDTANPVSPPEVDGQLDRIFKSPGFRNSQRLRRFLEFTVRCVLSGTTDKIKESVIGRTVFDRGSRYDPRIDSIVRVESQRLRRKLAEYYATDGRRDHVSIAFEPGSYIPIVSYAAPERGSQQEGDGSDRAASDLSPQTIAVLPLDNQSSDPEQEYFCDGVTEELIFALSTIPGLSVIGRTSVFALKGLSRDARKTGARLAAGTVISGSVRKVGNRLRIFVEMVDAGTGEVRWVKNFDRVTADNLFEIEEEIAHSIAGVLQRTLAPTMSRRIVSGAPNMDAYLLYLKGRHRWNDMSVEGYRSAIQIFERAIARFPSYAALYAGLADAHSHLAVWGGARPREAFPKAEQAARQALQLNPLLPHAYSALATAQAFYQWKWEEGTGLAKKATEMEPSYAFGQQVYGMCLLASGQLDDARACFERAVTLDPLSQRTNRILGWALYLERRFSGAEKWLEAALTFDAQSLYTRYLLVHVYLNQHRYDDALNLARTCDTNPPDPLSLGALGACFGYMGRKEEAYAIVARIAVLAESGYIDPLAEGQVQISLGNVDLAVECVGRCVDARTLFAAFLNRDPMFDSLRGIPKFNELISKLKQ
jgi:serine/threonine-protein kinase